MFNLFYLLINVLLPEQQIGILFKYILQEYFRPVDVDLDTHTEE